MKFGKNEAMEKANTNYERAIVMLSERKPIIGTDTKEKDGRFFVFGMELSETEYNTFLDQYNKIMDREIEELRGAA